LTDESRVYMLNGIKDFLGRNAVLWCVMLALLAVEQGEAQVFSLVVKPSTNSLSVNGTLAFTLSVTNLSGGTLTDVVVTNVPSSGQLFEGVTNTQGTLYGYTNGVGIIFDLGPMINGEVVTLLLTVQPVVPGSLTNGFTVADIGDFGLTNTAATNIVTTVIGARADLAVAITAPLATVITNDFTYFTLSVTNFGPDSVPNVALTNTLPAGFVILNLFPTNQFLYTTNTATNSTQIFTLGTLAGGGFTNITYEVAPTNTGAFQLAASVGAPNLADTNPLNNFATSPLTVTNYGPGNLQVIGNTGVTTNFQNGLLEETVTIANAGTNEVAAFRLVARMRSTNQFFNSVGTNLYSAGTTVHFDPFVVDNGPLAAGSSVELLLQFAPRTVPLSAFPILTAHPLSVANWSPPRATTNSAALNFTRIVKIPNGDMLLEFPTTAGQKYTVVYSDNVLFSNAVIAPPAVTAYANEMQWIDYGPPTTLSAPSNAPARFYRVYKNP